MRKAIALLIVSLLLPGCRDEGRTSPAADKIEKEVARRVEVAKSELKIVERHNRLRTIRIVGFVFLCGGAVTCLIWPGRSRVPELHGQAGPSRIIPPPQWRDLRPPRKGRVLDLGPGGHAPDIPPGRRSHETPPRH